MNLSQDQQQVEEKELSTMSELAAEVVSMDILPS